MIVCQNIDGTVIVTKDEPLGESYLLPDHSLNAFNVSHMSLGVALVTQHREKMYTRRYNRKQWHIAGGDRSWAVHEEDIRHATPEQLQVRYEEVEAAWVRLGGVMDDLKRRLQETAISGAVEEVA